MIPSSKSPQLQHRSNTGRGCIHQLLEGLSYNFKASKCSKFAVFFSQMSFLQTDVAQRHLVAGWSQLQTQKGPEGTLNAMPH